MKTILTALLALATVHGGGKLKLASKHLMVNSPFELKGTEFPKKESFTILLLGAAGRTKLGEIASDTAGKFATTVTIPPSAKAGSYRLILEAEDDDEAATVDVMVMAEGAMAAATESHDHDEMEMPSHEALALDRARNPLVTGGAVTTIILALAAGGLLLRRNGHA